MDKEKIEKILRLQPPEANDFYSHEVADILRQPSWLHPIRRYRFNKLFVSRVKIVLAEHTKAVLTVAEEASK